MRLHVEYPDRSRSVVVSIDGEHATARDLAGELQFDPATALTVDGVVHLPDTPLSDIAFSEGSRIASLGSTSNLRSGIGKTWAGVTGGPGAGSVRNIDSVGYLGVGRSEQNELAIDNPNVSTAHAIIERLPENRFVVDDLDSLNGTWVGDKSISKPTNVDVDVPIRVGSSTLTIREVDTTDQPLGVGADHADDRGKVLLNRPPRTPLPPELDPIVLPNRPAERTAPILTMVSLIVPIVFGAVMVLVLGSWYYAIFALLSPVMAIGNWLSGRRRVKRESEGDVRTHRESMATLKRQLAHAATYERERRAAIGPDLLEVRRRIELPSTRLWERRLLDGDALNVRVGVGKISFNPPTKADSDAVAMDVEAMLDEHRSLTNVELIADLREGPLAVVGEQELRDGAARALTLQLATHHGPADFRIAVLTSDARVDEWSWAHWLPHARTATEASMILAGDAASSFVSGILDQLESNRFHEAFAPGWLFIIDDLELLHRRSSPVRRLLERPDSNVFGIVLANTIDQLPASTASVASISSIDGGLALTFPREPGRNESGILDIAPMSVAGDLARQLARFEDPELPMPGGDVPRIVRAEDLLGPLSPDVIERRWILSTRTDKLQTSIGIGEQGSMLIDMVSDGPHALVAGTTGSGKSELLRTFIVGLAANYDPADLVFVLIDYKGGSAFDACARLPHVVGMVTDLDDHLAERALLSLEAELHHREAVLRSVAAKDIADYRQAGSPEGALPRLVVLIDEFATLRTELPDFVSALIGIAQRGRSLGVHLVLATQRPAGAVDANIRANTNLRIALRMQDPADSIDVIDKPTAAELSRSTPGRAYVRTGEGELAVVQSGFLSGPAGADLPPVRIAEVPIGTGQGPEFPQVEASDDTTELELIVETILNTPTRGGEPRRPWLPALPDTADASAVVDVELDQAVTADEARAFGRLRVALGDDPAHQRRVMRTWAPHEGGMIVVGALGSGVSTSVRSLIAGLGNLTSSRSVWVFPVDHAAGGLTGIDAYPHVSPVIAANDEARHARLFSLLSEALDGRRQLPRDLVEALPLMVVAIDGMASFVETNDLAVGSPNGDLWERIVRDGPAVGIVTIIGAARRGDVPRNTWTVATERIMLEQSDPTAFADIGVRPAAVPNFVPGRAMWGSDAMVVQMVMWEDSIDPADCVQIEELPDITPLDSNIERSVLADSPTSISPNLLIPVGIDDATRRVTQLTVRAGEHASICGPSGSGRTSALTLIAQELRADHPDLVLVGVAPGPIAELFSAGVFDAHGAIDGLSRVLTTAQEDSRRWILIVDDAERIDVEDGPLVDLAKNAPPNVTIIAAMRSSVARQAYGHWTRFVRASGTGILLQADTSTDGDLLGVRLPRGERLPDLPGRGYLVGAGEAHVIQLAR